MLLSGLVRSCRGQRRLALSGLALAWGIQAIVTQSLLLREALVLMFGSELAWGIVLFAWLFGVAAGATIGGWLAERLHRPAPTLVLVLLALSAAACLELWVFRGARAWLGVNPGQLLPLPQIALAALLFVSPASALVGMAFPLACCVRDADLERALDGRPLLQFGHVYAFESAGSLIGGAAFSFWAVEHLAPIQTALICGAITTLAAAALLATSESRARRHKLMASFGAVGLVAVALVTVLATVLAGDRLNRGLVHRRWRTIAPGYELVAEAESKYQNLALGRRAGQFTLYCDGQVSADFPDPYTFVPLAHFWLCQHPAPRRVLVLGGGAEGLLSEILRHPVEHIDYVEPDPRQIELLKPYLPAPDLQALADPRVTVHHMDGRHYVKTQRSRFDLVIARLPEPTSALRARFYTDEFYGELRRAMTDSAVLCLTACAAPTELAATSREYLASIRGTVARHFPHLIIGWGDPAQVLAATQAGLVTADPAELTRRYTRRKVHSDLFDPAWFHGATDWLDPAKLARRSADLDQAKDVPISTDLRPVVYVLRLTLWEATTGGGVGPGRSHVGVLQRLRSVRLSWLSAGLAGVGAVILLVSWLRHPGRQGWASGAVTLSVGSTGFVTMALSIVWLFAFQNLYGYVYQRIGWIVALFMAGLVVGSLWGTRSARAADADRACPDRARPVMGGPDRPITGAARSGGGAPALGRCRGSVPVWSRLVLVDVLLALLAAAVPLVLPALAALQAGPGTFMLVEWSVSLLVIVTGLLGGAAFPLAGRLQLAVTGRTGAAVGSVVGADHAGACLGALLCGILLVPVFGTAAAALLLAAMKLISAALLADRARPVMGGPDRPITGAARSNGA
jgi:spermidine synthase